MNDTNSVIGLCLSGGGYRAMLFHAGSTIRLNEFGLFGQIGMVSSVSGGSIVAGVLGLKWKKLQFDEQHIASNFMEEVVLPLTSIASQTIDVPAIILGILSPRPGAITRRVEAYYRRYLFGDATLGDLPNSPRFVFNASNLQSGVRWRFSKDVLGDSRVGYQANPHDFPLARAVTASSAFPPVLSPVIINLPKGTLHPGNLSGLCSPPYNTQIVLSDGGVYDNLGLQALERDCTTILVSDGGKKFEEMPYPKHNWLCQLYRAHQIIDSQSIGQRRGWFVKTLQKGERKGAYWGIRTQIKDYELSDSLPVPDEDIQRLSAIGTRLKSLPALLQQQLINWGYAVTDAAIRRYYPADGVAPRFPFPQAGTG